MKFVMASYGTRGDVEPSAAIGRELLRRGHDVRTAVSPDLVGFVESAGLAAVPCGPEARMWQDLHRDFMNQLFKGFWHFRDVRRLFREDWDCLSQCFEESTKTLMALADGADLIITRVLSEPSAADVADYYGLPLATVHTHPLRPNGQVSPTMPAPLMRFMFGASEWLDWAISGKLENRQRQNLGLPKATKPSARRVRERGSLEIQAYDEVCFPGLADEWAGWGGLRPFVGALTMELPGAADEEVASWIAAGTPPIFFGFGSTLVLSPADLIAMISTACAQMGERALICSAESDFSQVPDYPHVKVAHSMNYATVFPACRAVVHHGGAGTTAAGLRAGVPQLIISTWADQALWGDRVKRLKVGSTQRFSADTESLVADLRVILDPQYATRAREVATRMTKPGHSVKATADLLEDFARTQRVG